MIWLVVVYLAFAGLVGYRSYAKRANEGWKVITAAVFTGLCWPVTAWKAFS